MNITHMKYALTVAETRSINKAADILLVGAPALSRAIRDLESNLGVQLFSRSAKGMVLTPEGEQFVEYSRKALKQVDDIESMFSGGAVKRKQFSISVPRAGYISAALAAFSKRLDPESDTEIIYEEANAYRVIDNVINDRYNLGILRYRDHFDRYYRDLMDEKHLTGELVSEFRYSLLVSKNSPLAGLPVIDAGQLNAFIEIAHADPYIPARSPGELRKPEIPDRKGCRILVFERASQFELLSSNPLCYMWASPAPKELLDRYGLAECSVDPVPPIYRDVLIRRSNYVMNPLDKMFIEELVHAKRQIIG